MDLSRPNFQSNSAAQRASIYDSGFRSSPKNPKLRLKDDKRVEAEIIDVDFKSVLPDDSSVNKASADLAYRNSVYAKVQQQKQDIEDRRKASSENKDRLNSNWEVKISEAKTSQAREIDLELAKKLEQIDQRLANIEEALGLNGGVKNFKPSSLPHTTSQIKANPDLHYSKHVNDYSSLVKGIQELNKFKRDMGMA